MDALSSVPDPEDFTSQAQQAQDKTLFVKFYLKARPDRQASIEEGRPIFKDVEYIDIRPPGARAGAARPARPSDRSRFPDHYRAFKDRVEMPLAGTPLSEWPMITRSMAEELSFSNIKTVEQLVACPDSSAGQIRGIMGLKQKAKDWLELAKDDAPLERLNAELEKRDTTITQQQHTIETLTERLGALEALVTKQQTPSAPVPAPAATVAPTELDAASASDASDESSGGLSPAPDDSVASRRKARRRSRRVSAEE